MGSRATRTYASGLNGYAGLTDDVREGDMRPLFDTVNIAIGGAGGGTFFQLLPVTWTTFTPAVKRVCSQEIGR